MFVLPFFMLGCETDSIIKMGDVQGDLPVVLRLLDLGHPAAHLPGQGPGLVGHHVARVVHHGAGGHHDVRAHERRPHVPGPVGGGEPREVLKHGREAERLVEDAAGLVQVPERVPARGALHGEGNASLGHAGCGQSEEACLQKKSSKHAPCLSAEHLYTL
uniref:Uncharacterized protein n=1 Tax=Xiphophorus maculatus TaxID=8083 RepID=M3ZTY1_XIPMA